MLRADIIAKVKARMDELNPFDGVELNPSIDLVDSLLDEATTTVLTILPLYLIKPTPFTATTVTQTGRTGSVELDTDFLRLHSFKMVGWSTEVSQAISPQHPKYALQKHSVTMGGLIKPVVVIKSDDAKVNKVLYYYSLPDGETHTIETALYIKTLVADDVTSPDIIPDDLTDYIAWQCASDVFLAMEEVSASNSAKTKLMDLINLKTY